MTTRSTKRQRRSTVYLSSDDESQSERTKRGPGKLKKHDDLDQPDSHSQRSTTFSGERRSPEIPLKKTSTSIRGFFEPSNPENQPSLPKPENKRISSPINGIEDDDIIDDYDSYDELFSSFAGEDSSHGSNPISLSNTQSLSNPSSSRTNVSRTTRQSNPPKRFIVPLATDRSKKSPTPLQFPDGQLPWTQRYPPRDLDELAVHKKKVADVNNWLKEALSGNSRRKLLVLRGPAGTGKTTTVALLAKSLGFEIVEWKNPPVSDYASSDYVSVGKRFDEFLDRGSSYGGLDLDSRARPSENDSDNVHTTSRRVILIEEFPALNQNSPSLSAFRLSLQRCLATSGMGTSSTPETPIVMIVSETHLNSDSSLADNITVYRLLGPEICRHPSTTVIDFNSIAPTFMYKALGLVLDKEARYSGSHTKPAHAVLQTISKSGDIRSAINSLEFLCLRPEAAKALKTNTSKPKGQRKSNASTLPTEEQTLLSVSQRGSSLGIFHAVGKIVYNKRNEPDIAATHGKPPSPPPHLSEQDRSKPSQVSVDELIDETGTDVQTFISALHENYVPSCDGASFVDCVNGCIDALSDSDLLSPGTRNGNSFRHATKTINTRRSTGLDILRQDELSFQVATRGMLFSLPHPVKRCSRPTGHSGRRNNAHQMYFPASFRLVHDTEETEDLVAIWTKKLLDPFRSLTTKTSADSGNVQGLAKNEEPMTVTMISRSDLLLYQLPYMAAISCDQADTRELQRITSFYETKGDVLEGDSDELQTELVDSTADRDTWKPLKLKSSALNRNVFGPQLPIGHEDQDEKLILSDDDILDD
ncbi:Rad17 cell cycle checkpoint protein-domain-containing protein [Aspergillus floccosus]